MFSRERFTHYEQQLPNDLREASSFISEQNKDAHERVFKIVLTLSTLTLTGWVVIIAQLPEAFSFKQTEILISCSLFISSLLILTIGYLCTIVQTPYSRKIILNERRIWTSASNRISMFYDNPESKALTQDEVAKIIQKIFEDESKNAPSEITRSKKFEANLVIASWAFGIIGYLVFFGATAHAIFEIPQYVSQAQIMKQNNSENSASKANFSRRSNTIKQPE